jgi:RNA polymerase sigma-70 factor (ECF subfamily)
MNRDPDSPSDETLAEKARNGDRAAFATLCDRALPHVYNRLRALLPLEAVEDVTQEVFLAALDGIRRFRGNARFRTWISGICRHKVADYYRRRSRQPEVVPLEAHSDNPGLLREWEEQTLVRIALQRLPEQYQEVILLRMAEGMHFGDIATTLGISLEATKSRYRRAIAAMAREMGTD